MVMHETDEGSSNSPRSGRIVEVRASGAPPVDLQLHPQLTIVLGAHADTVDAAAGADDAVSTVIRAGDIETAARAVAAAALESRRSERDKLTTAIEAARRRRSAIAERLVASKPVDGAASYVDSERAERERERDELERHITTWEAERAKLDHETRVIGARGPLPAMSTSLLNASLRRCVGNVPEPEPDGDPLVFDHAFDWLEAPGRSHVLHQLRRLSVEVQVVVLTDDPSIGRWGQRHEGVRVIDAAAALRDAEERAAREEQEALERDARLRAAAVVEAEALRAEMLERTRRAEAAATAAALEVEELRRRAAEEPASAPLFDQDVTGADTGDSDFDIQFRDSGTYDAVNAFADLTDPGLLANPFVDEGEAEIPMGAFRQGPPLDIPVGAGGDSYPLQPGEEEPVDGEPTIELFSAFTGDEAEVELWDRRIDKADRRSAREARRAARRAAKARKQASGSKPARSPSPGAPAEQAVELFVGPARRSLGRAARDILVGKRCHNHPADLAAGECPSCHRFYCAGCLIEVHAQRGDGDYCVECAPVVAGIRDLPGPRR
ncbi:MAG: hypothetical protein JWL73_333 [Actinomycetia bacterium]|nr:hypothetical protein [Actinomycetes bacterium]